MKRGGLALGHDIDWAGDFHVSPPMEGRLPRRPSQPADPSSLTFSRHRDGQHRPLAGQFRQPAETCRHTLPTSASELPDPASRASICELPAPTCSSDAPRFSVFGLPSPVLRRPIPTPHAPRSMLHAPSPKPHACRPMPHAPRSMLHAPSSMPVAPWPMPRGPCSTPDPVARVASGMWLERAPQLGVFWVPSIGWAVAEARKRRVAVDVANHRIARHLQLGRLQGSPVNNLRISCQQILVDRLGLNGIKAQVTYRSVALSLP